MDAADYGLQRWFELQCHETWENLDLVHVVVARDIPCLATRVPKIPLFRK